MQTSLHNVCSRLAVLLGMVGLACSVSAAEVLHAVLDAGGGRSTSAAYSVESSLDGIGGISQVASLGQTNRVGYAAQLNESPEVPARNVTRSHGRSVKIPVADLLAGVADAEGDAFVLQSIDATSAQGVPVSVDGAWLLYQAGATSPTNDTIGITVTDALGATTRGVMTITELSGPGQSAISRTLLRIETLPDNISIRVSFVGIPGRSYRVEATTNLTTGPWEPIGISTAGTNGLYSVVEAPSFLVPSRFYRVFQP